MRHKDMTKMLTASRFDGSLKFEVIPGGGLMAGPSKRTSVGTSEFAGEAISVKSQCLQIWSSEILFCTKNKWSNRLRQVEMGYGLIM